MTLKSIIKKFIPPVILDLRHLYRNFSPNRDLYYFGNFSTWDEAVKVSNSLGGDYSSANILEQAEAATQKVRRGEALWDRDGVCFYEPHNNWPLLASLFYVNSMLNKISVLDFGGG